jgi:hypothetical protein
MTLIDSTSDELVRESAHHPFDAYFGGDPSALAPLCQALA